MGESTSEGASRSFPQNKRTVFLTEHSVWAKLRVDYHSSHPRSAPMLRRRSAPTLGRSAALAEKRKWAGVRLCMIFFYLILYMKFGCMQLLSANSS
jgi:hypothetical protein